MVLTDRTALVLRSRPYRENDRMLTLFSPVHGRVDACARGCRKPRSPLLAASSVFALGDYTLYEKNGRFTVTAVSVIETFYALSSDLDRLTSASYLLDLCERVIQPGQENRPLFMLLLHVLSRLTYGEEPWEALVTGFMARFLQQQGQMPELDKCQRCGKVLGETDSLFLDIRDGGLRCMACREQGVPLAQAQRAFLCHCLRTPPSAWKAEPDRYPPLKIMKSMTEYHVGAVRTLLP